MEMLLTLSSHEALLIKMLDQEENTCLTVAPRSTYLLLGHKGPSMAVFRPSPPEAVFTSGLVVLAPLAVLSPFYRSDAVTRRLPPSLTWTPS